MIKVIVHTITSERDTNGNCYDYAIFYNPQKSRSDYVKVITGGRSNAEYMAYRIAGRDYEAVLTFNSVIKKREWASLTKDRSKFVYEHESAPALAALFEIPLTALEPS